MTRMSALVDSLEPPSSAFMRVSWGPMRETPLPRELAARKLRVVRPRDAIDLYRDPAREFKRLADAGLLRSIARGYYVIPPMDALDDPQWQPSAESLALAIAQADHGRDASALTAVSAARLLGAVPRGLATAVVAIPARRRPLITSVAPIHFWERRAQELDLQRVDTELAEGWVTTAEQTILDLADRPRLGGIGAGTASEAIWDLASRSDWQLVRELSLRQGREASYARAAWASAGIAPSDVEMLKPRRLVARRGLDSLSGAPAADYGVLDDRR